MQTLLAIPRPILQVFFAWLALALSLSASGQLVRLHFPGPQLILASTTALLLLAAFRVDLFRDWLLGLRYRSFLLLHLLRFVGIAFLVLEAKGLLPAAFAQPAGWGDLVVALWALVLLRFVPRLESRRTLLLLWNLAGFLDILLTILAAIRIARVDQASLSLLLRFPLALLPTVLVPLIVASHVALFWRLKLDC